MLNHRRDAATWRANAWAGLRWILAASHSTSAVIHGLLGQVFVSSMYFITGIIVARWLGASGKGHLTAMILWPQFLGTIFALGLPNAYIYYARRYQLLQANLFAAMLVLSLGLSCIAVACGEVWLPLYIRQYGTETVRAAQIFLFATPSTTILTVAGAYFQAKHRFVQFNQLRWVPTLMTTALLTALALTGKLTPQIAAICYLGPSIPIATIALIAIIKETHSSLRGFGNNARRLLSYGLRGAGVNVLGAVAQQIDQFLVVGLLSAASMGQYTVGLSVSRVVNIAFLATYSVILSKSVGLNPNEITHFIGRAIRLTLCGAFCISLSLAAVLPFILPRIYGTDFIPSIPIADVLLFECNVSGCTSLLMVAYYAVNRPDISTMLEFVFLVAGAALMILVIPHFGILGAALALSTASSLRLLIALLLYKRCVGTTPPALILRRSDVTHLFSTVRGQLEQAAA